MEVVLIFVPKKGLAFLGDEDKCHKLISIGLKRKSLLRSQNNAERVLIRVDWRKSKTLNVERGKRMFRLMNESFH